MSRVQKTGSTKSSNALIRQLRIQAHTIYCSNIFSALKFKNSVIEKKNDIFSIYAQNIDCGYTLEPHR